MSSRLWQTSVKADIKTGKLCLAESVLKRDKSKEAEGIKVNERKSSHSYGQTRCCDG